MAQGFVELKPTIDPHLRRGLLRGVGHPLASCHGIRSRCPCFAISRCAAARMWRIPMRSPDFATRVAILRKRAALDRVHIEDDFQPV